MDCQFHITSGDLAGENLTRSGVTGEIFVWHDGQRCWPIFSVQGTRQCDTHLREHHVTPYCLQAYNDGQPGHPLYIGYDVQPIIL